LVIAFRLPLPFFACPKKGSKENAPVRYTPRSINWQVLNLFTQIPKLASLEQMGFLTVHCIKSFAQFITRGLLALVVSFND